MLQCIQERRTSATNKSGTRGGGSAGGGKSANGKRSKKDRAAKQAKADARQDVYDLLTSMGKECKLTMPNVGKYKSERERVMHCVYGCRFQFL